MSYTTCSLFGLNPRRLKVPKWGWPPMHWTLAVYVKSFSVWISDSWCLSLHFNGHLPGEPGLAGTRMSPFWILLMLRVMMMEVVVTTGAMRHAKLQSNCHHQQIKTQLFTGRMPFLSSNQQCQSTEWKLLVMCCLTYFLQDVFVIEWWQSSGMCCRRWNGRTSADTVRTTTRVYLFFLPAECWAVRAANWQATRSRLYAQNYKPTVRGHSLCTITTTTATTTTTTTTTTTATTIHHSHQFITTMILFIIFIIIISLLKNHVRCTCAYITRTSQIKHTNIESYTD